MKDFFRMRIEVWGLLTAAGFAAVIGSLSGFLGRMAWWMDLGSHFRVQYIVLFAVLAVLYMVGRRRAWAGACLLCAIINAVPVAAYLFPRRAYDIVEGPSIKAVQINVNSRQGNPDRVLQFLKKENPDVLILEEISDEWMRLLEPVLRDYPHRLVETRMDNFGMGLFSRVTTISNEVMFFGVVGVPSMKAHMELGGRPFVLLVTHPLPPGGPEYSWHRNKQLEDVAGYVRKAGDRPLILMGDLNVSPWSPYYHDFVKRSGLINSSRGRALHVTWPEFMPFLRIPIDHCLHSRDVAIVSKRVGESVGSDHYPVIVRFALKPEKSDGPAVPSR